MRRRLEVEKAERDIALNGGFATLRHWDEDGDRPLVNPYDSAVRPQSSKPPSYHCPCQGGIEQSTYQPGRLLSHALSLVVPHHIALQYRLVADHSETGAM